MLSCLLGRDASKPSCTPALGKRLARPGWSLGALARAAALQSSPQVSPKMRNTDVAALLQHDPPAASQACSWAAAHAARVQAALIAALHLQHRDHLQRARVRLVHLHRDDLLHLALPPAGGRTRWRLRA